MARQSRDGYPSLAGVDLREIVELLSESMQAPPNVREEARRVAGLQDLGLLGIRGATLSAKRPLDETERAELRGAPIFAQTLVASMPGYETVAEHVRHVHERWDGKGYPDGLKGTDIPLASRIVAVAAAFQAMSSPRPFRAPMHPRAIAGELRAGAGTQFDPEIVAAMLSLAREWTPQP
ncbi:MAG: hypothetical protein HZB14_03180 [Actinobacteria bacterium]|nr:hypothetical protein [Actinomycetota bacterium]